MLEIEYSVNQECIAQFFPIEAVVSAKLRLFEDILGQSLRRYAHSSTDSPDHALTWHEDVELYDVWDSVDRGGGFLGCLYLDLYSRPTRYTHVANFNLQLDFVKFDNTRYYLSTALICNFNSPNRTHPSLLKHMDVRILCHELGHGTHAHAARTKCAQFHGTACVDNLCEVSSQILEWWCWSKEPLRRLGRHYSESSEGY